MWGTKGFLFLAALIGCSGLALVLAACSGGNNATPQPSETAAPRPERSSIPNEIRTPQTDLTITALAPQRFAPIIATTVANTDIVIRLNNTEAGVQHSIEVLDKNAKSLGAIPACTGPCVGELHLNLLPGEYSFRCQIYGRMGGQITAK